MGRAFRTFLAVLAVVLVSGALSAVTTILLRPFWSWIESSTGVESIGHSGPAEWCYAVVFALFVAGGLLLFVIKPRRGKKDANVA